MRFHKRFCHASNKTKVIGSLSIVGMLSIGLVELSASNNETIIIEETVKLEVSENKSGTITNAFEINKSPNTVQASKNNAVATTGLESLKGKPIILESTSEKDAFGNYIISKVVKTDSKYPYIRIIEHFSTTPGNAPQMRKQSLMIADHLTVKLQEGVNIDTLVALADSQGYSIRKTYQSTDLALVSFPLEDVHSLEDAQSFFAKHKDTIAYAEADYLRFQTSVTPNDPKYSKQSYLYYKRDPEQTSFGADSIGAAEAWERRTDAIKDDGEYIKIGIIDSSFSIEHEDLINNIWQNPNEIADNGIDDDDNGYIDDIHGWNINTDSNYHGNSAHANHVSGIVAAEGNNGLGVSGIVWKAQLIQGAIFGDNYTSGSEAAEATRYLTAQGVHIINASYGSTDYMQVECDAIEEANAAGILFVTSAGNNTYDLDLDGNNQYPAECNVDNVISVGGGVTSGQDLDFGASNYGLEAVDIIAPFYAYSTYQWDADYPSDSYDTLEGTSMSSPMVAGSAALLMAEHPTLTHLEIKALLMESATRASGISAMSQSGMLNLARAINYDLPTRSAEAVSITASSNDGNLPENAMDDNTSSRWSATGVGETITFELSELAMLSSVEVQWFKGDERNSKFSIEASLDGVEWESVYGGLSYGVPLEQSSGSNTELEEYRVQNVDAQYVRITGYGNSSNDWNSIIETVINVYDETAPVDLELMAPTALTATENNTTVELSWNDQSEIEDAYQVLRSSDGGSWTTLATLSENTESYTDTSVVAGGTYEYIVRAALATQNGPSSSSVSITLENQSTVAELTVSGVIASTDDGNVADNTLDGSTSTRWSASGEGQWLDYDLGSVKTISSVNIAFYKGDSRQSYFSLSVQSNSGDWVEVYNGSSSGSSAELETFTLDDVEADTLRYTGFGNSSNTWNSITEIEIYGY